MRGSSAEGRPLPRREALECLWAALPAMPSLPAEPLATALALGRTTAEDVASPCDVPPFTRSAMDGYAVRAADVAAARAGAPVVLRVAGRLAMGNPAEAPLAPGEACQVPTGGMLPEGADAVVPVEETRAKGDAVDILAPVPPGRHVTARGADVREGDCLIPAGTRLRPADLAALTAAGVRRVRVRRAPRVAIVPTGDELVPANRTPRPGQIREFNSVGLAALAARDGAEASVTAIVPDDPDVQARVLGEALAGADAVLILGGSSVGARDFTKEVLGRFPGPGVLVHGVAIRPGRPAILAVVEDGRRRVPVFGVPGHPVSAMVVYESLVRPTLERMMGRRPGPRPVVRALVRDPFPPSSLEFHARVRLLPREGDPAWEAAAVPGDSAILSSLVRADGILRLPPGEGCEAGEVREVELLS